MENKDIELVNIWKSYDQKLDEVLSLNKEIVYELTKAKVSSTIGTLRRPIKVMVLIGIPYTVLLFVLSFMGYKTGAIFVIIGFGSIGMIMTATIIGYFYHLYLIDSISRAHEIADVQKKVAELRISSFNSIRMAIVQIPFWSICWMSLDALEKSPLVYGGANLAVFLGLLYLSYWLYKSLDPRDSRSRVGKIFFSGAEWEPIVKASEILEQLKDLRK